MRLSSPSQPLMLSYRGAVTEPAAPGPLVPLLSIVPGLFCWLLFASAAMPRELPILERVASLFGPGASNGVVLVAWGLAVATSLAALFYYARQPQPWYATLCMGVHVAGLLFSLLLIGGMVLLLIA
jgi:hypothetical protein